MNDVETFVYFRYSPFWWIIVIYNLRYGNNKYENKYDAHIIL